MNPEALTRAVALAQKMGHVLIATADSQGLPHIAPADQMTLIPEQNKITVEAWFCPGTLGNLQSNGLIALVVWDPAADRGFQISGNTEGVEDVMLLDGHVPGIESITPHGKKRLFIRARKIMAFQHAPHTDREE